MRKRVLILAYFFPPLGGGGVHRVLSFVRWLPAHGWDCTVICAGPEDYWVTDASLLEHVPASTEVIRVPGGSALSAWLRFRRGDRGRRAGGVFSGLRRLSDWWLLPDSYVGWASRAAAAARDRLARGDITALLSSSPPDSVHLAALRLGSRRRVPWIADFRDPWIGLHFREPPTRWHRARHALLERRVIESADLVLTASATHLATLGSRSGAKARRVAHLPNGFEPAEPGAEPAGAAPPDETFTLVWTGTLSQMPDGEVLLEAVHEVLARVPEARRRLRVRIAGPYDSGYQDRTVALGLTGIVEFMGPRSHAETRALQRRADVLLLWKPRGYPTMVPGKTYEYLDAGRPIVALLEADDEAAALVARAGGEIVPPGARAALAAAIERRYQAWTRGERAIPGRPDWLDAHARPRIAADLAAALDSLTEGQT